MPDRGEVRVLVIDDEAPIRLLCRVNLEAEGLDVLEAADGTTGLDLGGVDYVTKPFNPLELAPLVRDLLARIDRGERDELRGEKLAELRALIDSE